MAEVVLDANVLVALLDGCDVRARAAAALLERLEAEGRTPVLIDFLLAEAVSVLSRRARERKTSPPDLEAMLMTVWPALTRASIPREGFAEQHSNHAEIARER